VRKEKPLRDERRRSVAKVEKSCGVAGTVGMIEAIANPSLEVCDAIQSCESLYEITEKWVAAPKVPLRAKKLTCYRCRQKGHLARECTVAMISGTVGVMSCSMPVDSLRTREKVAVSWRGEEIVRRVDRGLHGGKVRNFRCWRCQGVGHCVRDCATPVRKRVRFDNSATARSTCTKTTNRQCPHLSHATFR
jgi:hypothetical protein